MATKQLSAVVTIGGTVSSGLKTALGGTKTALLDIGKAIREMQKQESALGNSVRVFARQGQAVESLRQKYVSTIQTLERMRAAQTRLTQAQERSDRINARAGTMARAGAGATVAGGAMLGSVVPLVQSAIRRENEANIIKNSGLSSHDQNMLLSAAGASRQFGVSKTEAFKTMRELQASLGSAHHAVEALPIALRAQSGLQLYNRGHAGKEVGDDAMYSLAKIADERGGAVSSKAMAEQMNLAFKAITASQGKVTASDWLMAQRGAKAAGVGMDSNAFFGDSFMVQALGAPQYGKAVSTLNNAWIGGHQDAHKFTNMLKDGLLDKSKVKTKNGLVTNYTADALVDGKMFIKDQQAWAEKYLIPLAKKKGVNMSDSAEVQRFVSDYTSNTNAGNVLFQRLFNMAAIDRDRKNYLSAQGIDESDKANQASTGGKVDNIKARYDDAKAGLGDALMPALTKGLLKATDAMESFNGFAKEHQKLVSGVVLGVAGLGAALVITGPLLGVAAGGMSLYAAMQLRAAAGAAASIAGIAGQTSALAGQNAVLSSGIGLFAKRALLVLGIANAADYIAGKMGVGGKTIDQAQDDKNWARFTTWEKIQSGIPRALEKTGGFLGMSNLANQAQFDRTKNETAYLNGKGMPAIAGTGAATPVQQNTFHINQLPGQSQEALARSIAKALEQQTGVKQRSAFSDSVGQ